MGILSRNRWNAFAEVFNDVTKYPSLASVAAALGISYDSVRHTKTAIRLDGSVSIRDRNAKETAVPIEGKEHRVIETIPEPYEEPIEELIHRVRKHNERYAEYHEQRAVVDIKVKVPGPYGVVGLPDTHLNNVGTLVGKAFDDAYLIAEHPALFCVGIGDWLDNFIVGRLERERRKDIMSHGDAWRMMEHYVNILAPKLIAAISGNHMDWTTDMGGVDIMKKMLAEKGLGPIYDPDEIRVRLISPNGQSFTHLARHKFPGHSKYNSMHGILVWMLERWQGEDVIWGGHIHTAAHTEIEKLWQGSSRNVHGVQLAAYKNIDGYATREGFRRNVPFMTPVTIHDPWTGSTAFFSDIKKGVAYLDHLRASYP